MLRLGIAGVVHARDTGSISESYTIIDSARQAPAINILSPYISMLRNQYKSKPRDKQVICDEYGNIVVEGILFKQNLWSKLIPETIKHIERMISTFY